MDNFEQQAIVTALKKMFKGGYFDICTVDACAKIIGCIPPSNPYNALRAIHCVNWGDMQSSFRNDVVEKVMVCLSSPTIDFSCIYEVFRENKTVEETSKKKLFGLLG
jgi:hypothetical protein